MNAQLFMTRILLFSEAPLFPGFLKCRAVCPEVAKSDLTKTSQEAQLQAAFREPINSRSFTNLAILLGSRERHKLERRSTLALRIIQTSALAFLQLPTPSKLPARVLN
ncbi:hypothetical protein WAI453_009210 [Rhynchosporium graminicola]